MARTRTNARQKSRAAKPRRPSSTGAGRDSAKAGRKARGATGAGRDDQRSVDSGFKSTFEHAPVGIAHVGLDGRYLLVNRALCEMLGYSERELLARRYQDLTLPEDLETGFRLRQRLLAGQISTYTHEKRYRRKDGRILWCNVAAHLVRDGRGRPRYSISVIDEISQRKAAEGRFVATFEQAAVGIAHTTPAGRFLSANRRLCDMLGYGRDELATLSTRELTHPDDRDRDDAPRTELIAGKRDHFTVEKRYLRKDGSLVWVNRTVTLALDAASGDPYLIQVFEDITGRKRAEYRLERANRAHRVLAECSHALVHGGDETRMLESMCRILVESGGYRLAWVGLATDDPLRPIRAVAHAGYGADEPMTGPVWSAEGRYRGFMNEVMAGGETRVARDILDDPSYAQRHARALQHGFQSSIALPLKEGERVLGAMAIYAREPDAFDDEEIALLNTLADDIAFGIVSARMRLSREQAEARSRENERRYRETFEQAAVGITRVDLNGTLVDVNGKFCEMLGYARHELIGKSVRDITHPDDYGTGAAYRARLAHGTEKATASEKRFIRRDGTVMWARRTMSAACDDAGNPQYVISVVEDITERKELEQRFELTFDHAAVGVSLGSLDGRYVVVNRMFADMLKYAPEELAGTAVMDLVLPEDRGGIERLRQKLFDGEVNSVTDERRYVRKDGNVIRARRTLSLARDATGTPLYFIGVAEDITESKEREERYRAIFANAAVGITRVDLNGILADVNQKFCDMLGYTREELLGRPVRDITHPEDYEQGRQYRMRFAEGGAAASVAGEKRFIRKDGTIMWARRTISAVRDDAGKPLYLISVVEDITERVLSSRRRAMEHAVARVLAGAATVDEAMAQLIRVICEAMDWAYGAHWNWSESERNLVRREWWSDIEFRIDKDDEIYWTRLVSQDGGGLLRRAWLERQPTWVADILQDESFRRRRSAGELGLRSAFSFPILGENEILGVMEFFGREAQQPDEMLLQITGSIGRQIGQFVRRKDAEHALRESEEHFRQLADNIPQIFWICDAMQREMIYVSAAYERVTGRPIEPLKENARGWLEAVHPEDRERIRTARKGAAQGQYDEVFRVVRPDGSIRWVRDRAFPVRSPEGGIDRITGIAEDITDLREAEERLMFLAHYDNLTSLPNRVLFYDRLKQALSQARRNGWTTGVMFLDLDRFKNVNDTLGHGAGDLLLRQVSERLSGCIRSGDTVGRLSGDEFSIVLSNLSGPDDASLVAQKIMASLASPFNLFGKEVFITASIGITLFPTDSKDQDTLIQNADTAMYRAKELGRNSFRFYTPEMNARALEKLSLESSLRRALERREFVLYYQPKASLVTGEITGVEALLRWKHPELGLTLPADFMQMLEETGLIVATGEWVIRSACAQIRAWQSAGLKAVPVAVNLSARQFQSRDLGQTISRILDEEQVRHELLELEITETSLAENTDEAADTLAFLNALGVRVAIDDFGTGHSNLTRLKRFPLDSLKIDSSFIRDITTDADDAAITRAIITMAHSLDLAVVAEGVETEQQLVFLDANGCDQIQGYYFSSPLEPEECAKLIASGRRLERPPSCAGSEHRDEVAWNATGE
ncbi:MAG: PAS domain S-box protein [Betaproteobacteria bacterium]|nr:PAS domain S-box protein [Betaproteobacteria bacterium]